MSIIGGTDLKEGPNVLGERGGECARAEVDVVESCDEVLGHLKNDVNLLPAGDFGALFVS